jgi:hypothetical protein
MFNFILLTIILLILSYFIVKFIMLSNHEMFTTQNIVKYKLNSTDEEYMKKYGKNVNKIPKMSTGVFCTEKKWSPNNYLLFNKKYYIIEPGYYYRTGPDIRYNNGQLKIIFLEKK